MDPRSKAKSTPRFPQRAANILRRYLPVLERGAAYTSKTLPNDLIVAVIVTVVHIPQSPAYALPDEQTCWAGFGGTQGRLSWAARWFCKNGGITS